MHVQFLLLYHSSRTCLCSKQYERQNNTSATFQIFWEVMAPENVSVQIIHRVISVLDSKLEHITRMPKMMCGPLVFMR